MKRRKVSEARPVEQLPGIIRRTLAHSDLLMLCQYTAKKGSKFLLHNHPAAQIGYVVSGRLRFMGATDADTFEAVAGQSYVFEPYEQHGADVLEDAVILEIFTPSREEFKES